MITAQYIKENEWNKGELLSGEIDFQNVNDLSKFLSYNGSYIRKITFIGSLEIGE